MTDTVLIVDDEEPVRRTFQEWLRAGVPAARVLVAADAESALLLANEHPIDLAVLDWNLGEGSDGLRLLEDLAEFHPDVVAILITGFAHQATPLDALRMGVRDYLDKNQDLSRDAFLAAVRRQLDRIRPAKRQRELNRGLAAFRAAVEQVIPIVRAAAALNDPVPLPDAVRSLLRFTGRFAGAADGALVVRVPHPDGGETVVAYGAGGVTLPADGVPFSRSLAATAVSLQEPCVIASMDPDVLGPVELFPFEQGRQCVLAAPLPVGAGAQVVLELFDKPDGFTPADRQLVAAAADVGGELIRQAVAERQTNRLLFDAVDAALKASDRVAAALADPPTDVVDDPHPAAGAPEAALERLKAGLGADANAVLDADATLRLVEAVRGLAVRHGPAAVDHCVAMVNGLRALLDAAAGE